MPELEPHVLDVLERRLRTGLRSAAEAAPEFRGLPASGTRTGRSPRTWNTGVVLAAACMAVVAVGGVALWQSGRDEGGTPALSCSGRLTFQGGAYEAGPELVRIPARGQQVGRGTQAGCTDGSETVPDRDLAVRAVSGVDPHRAVYADGTLWVRTGSRPPGLVRHATEAVPCSLASPVTLTGTWQGATPSGPVASDGDLRPPYTVDLLVTDPRVVPRPYGSARLSVAVTTASEAPTASEVQQLLQHAAPSTVTLRCSGSGFVADRLTLG